MLNKDTGFILDGSCTCKASAMGRCSHVSSLLFAIEDYLINNGNMPTSCTSQPCKWNKGASLKTSSEVMLKQYSYKRDVSIIKEFSPLLIGPMRRNQLTVFYVYVKQCQYPQCGI